MKNLSKIFLSLVFATISFSVRAELSNNNVETKVENKEKMNVEKNNNIVPIAKKIPNKKLYHGQEYLDDYAWLREKSNPDVISYLKAENNYTEKMMSSTKALQSKLYKEMLSKIKEDDSTVPEKDGDFYYYSKSEKGKQYPIYCRKFKNLKSKEEILLDGNKLAGKSAYFSIGDFEVSKDGKKLAYAIDLSGSENYTIHFKDLKTGKVLKDKITNTSGSIEWSNDNKYVFYTIVDKAQRPFKALKHLLGTDNKKDTLVYNEKDESYYLSISKSKSDEYIFLNSASQITTEVRYINANKPTEQPKIIAPREKGVEYYAEHLRDNFVIMSNEKAPNYKVLLAPINSKNKSEWYEIVPHGAGLKIDNMEVFKDYLVLQERENAYKKLLVIDLNTYESKYIKFDEPAYDVQIDSGEEYNSTKLRFNYESFTTPDSTFDYDLKTGKKTTLKIRKVLGKYNAKNYQSERIYAKAKDGTLIPISLVYKKGTPKDGTEPLMLSAYGSYGLNEDPNFSSSRLSLLDRGFVYAIAHIRGGGDMGREWYDNGKFLNKKNTFNDFISCAEHLVNEKYTSKEKLAISGGSAGGLLMGAVTNARPDLFKSVIADVPFVDVINTMMDPSLPLTVIEYDEWGNPNNKKFFDYMKSYSPYDNVEAKEYPNMLITAGLNDPRVSYWEPAKFTAKLRSMKKDDNLLLLKTNMGAGHGGSSGRYDYLKDIAFEYAFILKTLGMDDK